MANKPGYKPAWFPKLPPTLEPLSETAIDPILEKALYTLEQSSDVVLSMIPALKGMWEEFSEEIKHIERDLETGRMKPEARTRTRKELGAVVNFVERISKGMAYHSRLTDELTRLRIYLAGGADSRREIDVNVDVGGLGELELVEMMLTAAAQSGKLCPDCTRRALAGSSNGKVTQAIEGPR